MVWSFPGAMSIQAGWGGLTKLGTGPPPPCGSALPAQYETVWLLSPAPR